MTQYTLEMVPLVIEEAVDDGRRARQYHLSEDTCNIIDQVHLVSGIGKGEFVELSIRIMAAICKTVGASALKESEEEVIMLLEACASIIEKEVGDNSRSGI